MQETLCRPEEVDLSRHFSYYAFEGQSGALRWKHEVWISIVQPSTADSYVMQIVNTLSCKLC